MAATEKGKEVLASVLARLNAKQLECVTADIHKPLQIIAGPGTGKTAVLTARVAYLLLECHQEPHHIIVTTFTKKAANEMIERLGKLIPNNLGINLANLLIGTFHSLCVRILKQNGHHIGLPPNFKVADERDAKEVLRTILSHQSRELQDLRKFMEELRKTNQQGDFDVNIFQDDKSKLAGYDLDKVRRHISTLKANGIEHSEYASSATKSSELSLIYSEYQKSLLRSNYVDFDDILLHTKKLLFTKKCLPYVKHVLVDEFQDTNKIQLDLMYLFSSQSQDYRDNVTVVGDPDQSIYAFRNALSENFDYMRNHYKRNVEVIFLNQNYRSINSVLALSESLMTQERETTRKAKNLVTQLEHDFRIVNNRFETNQDEADFIAHEISMLLKFPGLFVQSDFAILLRSRFHSRVIEQSLRRKNIPYKVLQGKAFWELKEIQTFVDYLRCVVSDVDKLPFMRVVNVPPRGIGTKSLEKMRDLLDNKKDPAEGILNFFEHLESTQSKSLGASTFKGINNFADIIKNARSILQTEPTISNGIDKMFSYLVQETNMVERSRPDDPKATENNLNEFKREIIEFEMMDRSLPDADSGDYFQYEDEAVEQPSAVQFLANFIESIDLYEKEPEEKEGEQKQPKVVISTIHGAKGLEWPVVFVPSLTESYFPASWALRSESSGPGSKKKVLQEALLLNEERRALYVAITRAKTSLYLSGFSKKVFGDEVLEESRFLKNLSGLCEDRNQALARLEALEQFYLINLKEFPTQKRKHLEQALAQYQEYHDDFKHVQEKNDKKFSAKSQRVPIGGGFITNAGKVLHTASAKPVWKGLGLKRKAPLHSSNEDTMECKKRDPQKKSFAPVYTYSRKSFK